MLTISLTCEKLLSVGLRKLLNLDTSLLPQTRVYSWLHIINTPVVIMGGGVIIEGLFRWPFMNHNIAFYLRHLRRLLVIISLVIIIIEVIWNSRSLPLPAVFQRDAFWMEHPIHRFVPVKSCLREAHRFRALDETISKVVRARADSIYSSLCSCNTHRECNTGWRSFRPVRPGPGWSSGVCF